MGRKTTAQGNGRENPFSNHGKVFLEEGADKKNKGYLRDKRVLCSQGKG